MMMLAPSLLSADFSKLGEDIKELEAASADLIHIDVMDGSFVPNISFGVPIIKSVRKVTTLPFDVHLMIENPSKYIEDFARAGADIISVHIEADRHIDRTINLIKSYGIKASVALNPSTTISTLEYIISELDMVLIMSVNPGFGGQRFIEYSYEKISQLRELALKKNKNLLIEVDGGIDSNNSKKIIECGADIVVAGSSVFEKRNIRENILKFKEAI